LSRTTASVMWNSAMLRIMVFADIIAMFADMCNATESTIGAI